MLAIISTCLLLWTIIAPSPKPVQPEYLLFKQVKINGRIPLESRKVLLFRELGQPDSVAKPVMHDVCTSFHDKPFFYAYFKGSEAELYGDMAVLGSIRFAGNLRLTLTTPTLTLSSQTTLAQVARYFPKAVAARKEIDVHQQGKYMAVYISTSRTAAEGRWILFFRNGQLARLDYWMPC